jgi:SHS2 domain-containing protein
MRGAGWEHFGVEPSLGVRGWGATRSEAFAQATVGAFALRA